MYLKKHFLLKKKVCTYLEDFTGVQHQLIFDFFKKKIHKTRDKAKKMRDKNTKCSAILKIESRAFIFMGTTLLYDKCVKFYNRKHDVHKK